jgi:hypothetical protein
MSGRPTDLLVRTARSALIVAAVLTVTSGTRPVQATPTGYLQGTVTDASSGDPLPGATVDAVGPYPVVSATT